MQVSKLNDFSIEFTNTGLKQLIESAIEENQTRSYVES